jgi:hypothetical protein
MTIDQERLARIQRVVNSLGDTSLALKADGRTWNEVKRTPPTPGHNHLVEAAKYAYFYYHIYAVLKQTPFEPCHLLSKKEFDLAITHPYFSSHVTQLGLYDLSLAAVYATVFQGFTGQGDVPYPDRSDDAAWITNVLYLLNHMYFTRTEWRKSQLQKLIFNAACNVIATMKTEQLLSDLNGIADDGVLISDESVATVMSHDLERARVLFNKALYVYRRYLQMNAEPENRGFASDRRPLPRGVFDFRNCAFSIGQSPWLRADGGDWAWIANMLYSKMIFQEAIPGLDGKAIRVTLHD